MFAYLADYHASLHRRIEVTLDERDTGKEVGPQDQGELQEALHTPVQDLLLRLLKSVCACAMCNVHVHVDVQVQCACAMYMCNVHVHVQVQVQTQVWYLCFLDILQAGHAQLNRHIVVHLQGHKLVLRGPAETSGTLVGQVGRLGRNIRPYQPDVIVRHSGLKSMLHEYIQMRKSCETLILVHILN